MGDPIRLEAITRILQALSEPDILEYETEELNVEIPFYLPCPEGEKPTLPKADTNGPYLVTNTSCGAAFEEIIVEGFNMPPFAEGPLYFVVSSGVRKQLGIFSVDENGYFIAELELPNRQPVEEAQTIRATVSTNIGSPKWSTNAIVTWDKMIETIQMAFLTTVFAAILAALFSFLLLKTSSGKLKIINTFLQLIFVAIRSVHPLIIGIPAIIFVGIGPMAGVLALTLFSTVVLIEKYEEYIRGNPALERSKLLSAHLPGIAFKYLPVNITLASIIGFVGGGGIGFLLSQNINLLDYRAASTQLIAIILVCVSIDRLSDIAWRRIRTVK